MLSTCLTSDCHIQTTVHRPCSHSIPAAELHKLQAKRIVARLLLPTDGISAIFNGVSRRLGRVSDLDIDC